MPRFRNQALLEVVRGGSEKKRNIDIGNGGGHRPLGVFSKIHQNLGTESSLNGLA